MGRHAGGWDPALYVGSAPFYARGRLPYPPETADALRHELGLDGTGRLLDVGCGPGSLTLLLAPLFAEAVGVDPHPGMIVEAEREAARRGVANVRWVEMPAEALPGNLGTFRVVTFAQSFHWLDREAVASTVRAMLAPGGHWVHVSATTHQGVEGDAGVGLPTPPREEIRELVREYLGPGRRVGSRVLPEGAPSPSGEEEVMLAAGYSGPRRIEVAGHVHERSEDDVVASVFSLSWAAPHHFGHRVDRFERELRQLLRMVSPTGRFAERARAIELAIWSP
ncbi:MAG TPA: class I SAM-dependent methyltransferase [Gaiellaceae bacterium]|nr:class I SAM-dependent methyltransferase [Gaiellaceae bacterium]